jgi:L-asparagine transporter-like permease
MAQTSRRRRRKRRGTQSGRVDRRGRGRPRSRREARDRAKAQRTEKRDQPPTWSGAITRGLVAAGIFFVLIALVFRQPVEQAVALALFMLAFYIPMGYFIDQFLYRRRQRQKQEQRSDRG